MENKLIYISKPQESNIPYHTFHLYTTETLHSYTTRCRPRILQIFASSAIEIMQSLSFPKFSAQRNANICFHGRGMVVLVNICRKNRNENKTAFK